MVSPCCLHVSFPLVPESQKLSCLCNLWSDCRENTTSNSWMLHFLYSLFHIKGSRQLVHPTTY
jgi:hypothetical protein